VEARRLSQSVRASILTQLLCSPAGLILFYYLPAPLAPAGVFNLVWSFGSQYVLPIVLNAAQLAISSYLPSSNTAMLIDSAKVVINIASASVTTLRTKHLTDLAASSALLGKAEDLARDMLKVVPGDATGATVVSARTLTTMVASGSTTGSQTDSIPKVSTPKLNPENHLPSSIGSS
jgi:hypothetical protein